MEIYHEKQSLLLCAKHAINNILQEKAFSKDSLNKICEFLTATKSFQLNPHKSALNLGNYDVNVIEAALQQKGYYMSWFDARNDITTINLSSNDDNYLLGLIINIKEPPGFQKYFLSSDQHWIAIRYLNGSIYNLDSKLKKPAKMSDNYLREYLKQILLSDGHVFLVQKIIEDTDKQGSKEKVKESSSIQEKEMEDDIKDKQNCGGESKEKQEGMQKVENEQELLNYENNESH